MLYVRQKLGSAAKTYVLKCHSDPTFGCKIIKEKQYNTGIKMVNNV